MNLPKHNATDIFSEALRLTNAAERDAYLDRICAGDPALRQEVESLLSAYAQAGDFLGPTISLREPDPAREHAGTRIGRYKLLEQIGEGGFGVVWMAEQEEPVRRRVALKIIKLGMDTREVVARFEAERQALAMMDHPNIAVVFDGGATDTGRPYFVMELVKGIPITDYCDANKLSTRERLGLFMQVCHAVQHAHQKGVIHRDLKPTNVLVTVKDDQPVPKVIDFGVAKATEARLTEKTFFTRAHQWIGTPAYMSPEQAGLGNLEVDSRSDLYSLGVLLYELLTGHTPFDTHKLLAAGYEAVMRTIREEEPPKPSTRLSTLAEVERNAVAARRGAEPAKLNRLVQGDLDWIVMKAMEKERQRRYETATSLAADLERYLTNAPVTARPPNATYRLGKYLRRHRVPIAVSISGVIGLALVAVVAYRLASFHAAAPTKRYWGEWEFLYDGTSTGAFHAYGQTGFPSNRWMITADGELKTIGDGAPSYLITTAEFDDFELSWEWAAERGGNSGVIFRASEYYDEPYKCSPEYQLVDEEEPNDIPPAQKSGAAWGLIAPTSKVLKSPGEWNQSRLLVLTNHVEHWLSGRKIVEYDLDSKEFRALVAASPFQDYPQFGKTRKGGIAFQNWSPGVSFRNVKVRRLLSK